VIDPDSWRRPAIFDWLQQQGNVPESEMLRTFNCGVGMVVCVPADGAEHAIHLLTDEGETVWRLGHIEDSDQPPAVELSGGPG